MASGRSQRRERARAPERPPPPPPPGLAEWTAFGAAAVFVGALVVRLLFWHATPGTGWPHNAFFKGDAIVWLQHALAIERGRPFELGLPLRPPGAAWLIALLWDGRRESVGWLRVAWAIQGALAPAVMFVALRRAFSPFVAWVAAALAAASTGLILLSSSLGNEAPYLLLVLLTLALFEPVRLRPSVTRLGTWSLLHGVACLFRVEHALFYVFCLALLYLSWRAAARGAPSSRTAAGLTAAALSAAFFAGPLLPWHVHAWGAVRRFNTVPPPAEGEEPFRRLEASLGPLTWDPAARARREQLPAFARTSGAVFVAATVVHRGERRIDAADFAILDEAFGYVPRPLPRYPFVASYGPLNFALANAPGAGGGFDKSRMREPPPLSGGAGRYPPQLVQGLPPEDLALTYPPHLRLFNEGYRIGLRWIAGHPGAFAALAARKLAIFWEGAALGFTGYDLPLGLSGVRRSVDLVVPEGGAGVLLWRLGMLAAAVAGIAAGWRRPGLHPWLAFLASKLIVTVAFFGYARQGALASPVVLLLVALAAERWLLRGPLSGASRRPHVPALAILVAATAFEHGRWSDRPQVLIDGQVVTSAADPVPLDAHRQHRVEVRPRAAAPAPAPR
jgi:hypothetical protein